MKNKIDFNFFPYDSLKSFAFTVGHFFYIFKSSSLLFFYFSFGFDIRRSQSYFSFYSASLFLLNSQQKPDDFPMKFQYQRWNRKESEVYFYFYFFLLLIHRICSRYVVVLMQFFLSLSFMKSFSMQKERKI